LAGRTGGALYMAGGTMGVLLGVGTDVVERSLALYLAVAVAGATWGVLCTWVIDWRRAPGSVLAVGTFAGLAIALFNAAVTGADESPVRLQVLFVLVYAAYFFPVGLAALAGVGAVMAAVLPLVLTASTEGGGRTLQAGLETVYLLNVALVIVLASRGMRRARASSEQSARREEALRALATAVASERPLEGTLGMAAARLGELLEADAASVMRFDDDRHAEVVGVWARPGAPSLPVGTSVCMPPVGEYEALRTARAPIRVDAHDGDSESPFGCGCLVLVPVVVADEVWGVLGVSTLAPRGLPASAEARIGDVAQSVALAVGADAARRQLTTQALTDSLTGLANRRAFHERLEEEVSRALRHGRPLTLVVLDFDAFKVINDTHGHAAGDRALVLLASALRSVFREDDLVGRLGGDEFAVLLPETSALEALVGIERTRAVLAAAATGEHFVPCFSAGLCDLEQAEDAEALERRADAALYHAKREGTGVSWVYDRAVTHELSTESARRRRGRAEALGGLHALARAIDAKDHLTQEHSTRVAELAEALAAALGWAPDRIELLREATILHDVGKIGVPDSVLLKPGRLDAAEYEAVKLHAVLGAQIVDGVLTPEQVRWVRGHHERADGTGYPDGLIDAEIPEGAAVLGVADAFDAMTSSRPYGVPLTVEEALAQCRAGAGSQFRPAVVDALCRLRMPGGVNPAGERALPRR
jgi:diguanylate cyclase (GGDEF)-like protein/putative nucleotidyltransferase with HDIG domain